MFTQQRPLKVFLSYASQDRPAVREIYDALKLESWIDPWLDNAKIRPGEDWQLVIETAVDEADVAILCFSNQSVSKEGFVQREIRYVYDIALEKPEGTIFLIPLRLDECEIPRKLRFLQRVDYFGAEKTNAYSDLLDALKVRYDQKLRAEDNHHAQKEREKTDRNVVGVGSAAAEKVAQTKVEPAPAENHRRRETSPTEKLRRKRKRRINSTIMASLIGVAGTIITTLIAFYLNRPTPTQTSPPMATATLTSTATGTPTPPATNTATSTPTTTTTPTPTFTGVTPFPLGEDWLAGCVSTLWKPYPTDIPVTERGDGCWNEPVYVFEAENGDLDFLAQGRNEESKIYGLFARIPERGTVTVKVRFSELTNVDIWLGVFAEQDVTSQGLLMTIPHGSANKRVIVQKDPRTGETITGTRLLEQGNGFSISFTFTANSARSTVNPSVFFTDSVSIPSSQKWLFLGYKSLVGYYRAEGRFLEFELVE